MAEVQANQAPSRIKVRERYNYFGYLFIAPAVGLYLVFNVWPIVRGFLMAFTDYRFIYPDTRWNFNGFSNFTELNDDPLFWHSVGVTIRYTLFVLPSIVVISLILAVVISKVDRLAAFYRWAVYLPVILPVAVTYLMFGQMYNYQFGLVNTTLRGIGIDEPPRWLSDVQYVLPALGISDIWRSVGLPTLLFLVGIYSIGSETYEAAALDGANGWQQLRTITLPLLKPIIALVIVLNLALIPMVIDPMLILTNGGPQDASLSLSLNAYQIAFQFGDLRLGYASAINLVLGLAAALVALVVFFVLRDDQTERRPRRGLWKFRSR
jgi:ABC-type sugar transport system permease subunit